MRLACNDIATLTVRLFRAESLPDPAIWGRTKRNLDGKFPFV
jgi:hypothetical protein